MPTASLSCWRQAGRRVVVVAVGDGFNGDAMGMIAAWTGLGSVKVPATLVHYDGATTSAKEAFNLGVNGQVLSENISGG